MSRKLFRYKSRKIKIIAGKWKGRAIPVVSNQPMVRPTTSIIRETLFNWLGSVVYNAICLDCFAGSGALGLESLSRGADKVTFLDKNFFCIVSLIQTMKSFQDTRGEIIQSDCCAWLRKTNDIYDIIFIDPPFCNSIIILEVVWLLEQYQHFSQQSWIYIELSKNQNIFSLSKLPKFWHLYRTKSTKSISIFLYYRSKLTIR